MSLLNSVFYTTVDDLLLNRINLTYLDTVMATAGAYDDTGHLYGTAASNPLIVAQGIYNDPDAKFVLVVEGAIPTEAPPGANAGDYCRIGDLTGTGKESVLDNVSLFANHAGCLAVLSVGTCSSFGGIPGAKGNVTGAKGVAFSGTALGGAIVDNKGIVSNIKVTNGGSGYNSATTVTVSGGGATTAATAECTVQGTDVVASLPWTATAGTPYANVVVTIDPPVAPDDPNKVASAYAKVDDSGNITALLVSYGGLYTNTGTPNFNVSARRISDGATITWGPTAATMGLGTILNVAVKTRGAGYTSVPTVTFSPAHPSGATLATATASITKGSVKTRSGDLAPKVFNISGCPPHPDWIVGTIAALLDTNLSVLPPVNYNYQPVDYGYKDYQCNAGPCPWRFNNNAVRDGVADHNTRYPEGNSKVLGKNKYAQFDPDNPTNVNVGCLGILGCKGRKTKADCSRRRWNADAAESYGVNWCVGSRAGCHGCTEPTFPDKAGKFFTFA